jgi:hypothetical protein
MNSVWALHSRISVGNVHGIASILALAILWAASLAVPLARAQATGSPKPHVNSQRLQGTLEKLSEFGRNPEGGVTRIGFSETDLAAREYVTSVPPLKGKANVERAELINLIFEHERKPLRWEEILDALKYARVNVPGDPEALRLWVWRALPNAA